MAFQQGNKAGAKSKIFGAALQRALLQYETDRIKGGQACRAIADKAIEMALAGQLDAIRFIAERLDGKPDASIDVAVRRSARDLSDDELASIAAGSSEGTADTPSGEE